MTPREVENAASFLKVSTNTFVQTYASRTLHEQDEGDFERQTPWVRLVDTNDGACIFLNSQNQCGIYEARPVQCSTYPYWPDIIESEKTWNAQVRVPDHHVVVDESSIPHWTPHSGGCEGMQFIGNSTLIEKVVSPYVAYEQLMEYEQAEQSFPSEPIIRRVKRKTKGEKN
jgi:Fe-S-cluster containining protein